MEIQRKRGCEVKREWAKQIYKNKIKLKKRVGDEVVNKTDLTYMFLTM